MSGEGINEDVPQELVENFEGFRNALDHTEEVMKRLVDTPRNKILHELTPLEVAKLDLVSAYSINSLFWMYLITQGINPRQHEIKRELERIKSYMGKVKEIEDRGKAPKLQKAAAKRFVRNAMFDLEDKNKQNKDDDGHSGKEELEDNEEGAGTSLDPDLETKTWKKEKPQKNEKRSKDDRKRQHGRHSHKQSKKSRMEAGKKKRH